MKFSGTWMTESQSMVYRSVPKCACSTIGQIMFYSDHGRFFDGDIHDAKSGLHKWGQEESRPLIQSNVIEHKSYNFTCARNPYSRVLSSFFDKIAGVQRDGRRYRGNQIQKFIEAYGVDVGCPEDGFQFDQIKSFRRFLLFARDTIRWKDPIDSDIHWSSISGHISKFIRNGGQYDHIILTESFNEGMQVILNKTNTPYKINLKAIPKFNESEGHGPKRAHPVEAYFDDLSMELIWDIYKSDFKLFNYDFENPTNKAPKKAVDVAEINAKFIKSQRQK